MNPKNKTIKMLAKKILDKLNSKDGVIYNWNTDKASVLICELIRSGAFDIESCDSLEKMDTEISWHMDMAHRASGYLGDARQKFISFNWFFNNMSIDEKKSAIEIAKKDLT